MPNRIYQLGAIQRSPIPAGLGGSASYRAEIAR